MPFSEFRFLDGDEDCDAEFQSQMNPGQPTAASKKNLPANASGNIPRGYPCWTADSPSSPKWGVAPGQPAQIGDQVVVKVQPTVGGVPTGAARGWIIQRDGHGTPTGCDLAALSICQGTAKGFVRIQGTTTPIECNVMGPGAWGTPPYVFV